jgi:hypothetical protein
MRWLCVPTMTVTCPSGSTRWLDLALLAFHLIDRSVVTEIKRSTVTP